MESNSYLLMNISILYRCGQKYFDKQLSSYNINAAQLPILIYIYEHEGTTMQQLALKGCFDKGTITKNINKLIDTGYVFANPHPNDKRSRVLYTSDSCKDIISQLYLIRRQWWHRLTADLSSEQLEQMGHLLALISERASEYEKETNFDELQIFGLQKLSLLDYPGKMASTLFTGGCNMRCPFCQNAELVFLNENTKQIPHEDILDFLKKRKNVLEGICISGGEPLLNPSLEPFLEEVKALGYKIKLDTNGSFPKRLKMLVDKKLIDYVAMDIKNCLSKYQETIDVKDFDLALIKESVDYLLTNPIPYEFRTTIVKEFHTKEDMIEIAKWIKGARAYYLQGFEDSEHVIQKGLHAYSLEALEEFKEIVINDIPNTHIRGL